MLQQIPQPAHEQITFNLARPGVPVPSFSFVVDQDGTTIYQASYPPDSPKHSPYAESMRALPPTEATLHVTLTPALTAKLFEKIHSTEGFKGGCASRAKNIADTGTKTLTYTGPSGTSTCQYNYTEARPIVEVTNAFQAIAVTLDEGRKLEAKHRYDRLALEPETIYLLAAAKNGDAIELQTIAPILQTLAADPAVLERVRNRAAKLLEQAGLTPPTIPNLNPPPDPQQ